MKKGRHSYQSQERQGNIISDPIFVKMIKREYMSNFMPINLEI